eukprot:scaffold238147_cov48-Prasinocladus_malaysianus.AAC.1
MVAKFFGSIGCLTLTISSPWSSIANVFHDMQLPNLTVILRLPADRGSAEGPLGCLPEHGQLHCGIYVSGDHCDGGWIWEASHAALL